MKQLFLLFFLLGSTSLLVSQEVNKNYHDGRLYVKLNKNLLKEIEKEDPQNINLNKFKSFQNLFSKYEVNKVKRSFYQASDDLFLKSIIKVEFKQIQKINSFIEELSKTQGVELVEKVPYTQTDITPNDFVGPHLTQINATNAWNVFNGNSNITLAIIDNAVMWTHSDLVANTYTNSGEIANNNIDDDGNGYIDDVNGYDVADLDNNAIPTNTLMDHGTHCAGIAGARTDNNNGIASIGWNIKIIPVKCAYNGSGTAALDAEYEGIVYAAKAKARIISCSWGGAPYSITHQAVIDYAWNKGCIIFSAAGNTNSGGLYYPAAYNHVYSVASVDNSDIKSTFSNYGSWVDISAPGENIYSTIPSVGTGTYNIKSGTSMATPLVAGLAGLMLSKCPWMSSTDVLNCISSTAVNIYTLGANSSYTTGNQLGAGRIDAFQAMNCANGFLTIPPIANFFAYPLNSCPSTPVQFYDSSLYSPTNYTWTFQGGTPLTSNSSSPSVQWSTAGTYSVTLTVSNANGSNVKTKLSYITIAGPQSIPFAEGFESLPFLPANWTPKNVNYDLVYWLRHTGTGGFGTSTACAKFDNYNFPSFNDRDEMRTPKFNFSNVALVRLRYDVAYALYAPSYSDTLEVKLSVNCGTTWSVVSVKGGTTLATAPNTASQFVPTSLQWRRDTFDISANTAGQNNVMFSFINRGHYGQPIYLDNINLVFPTPSLNINPIAPICIGNSINLVNTSTASASYTWSFPGGSPATSTQSNPSVSYANPGIYTVTLNGVNGTSTASITRTVNVLSYPAVSANSPTMCYGSQTTLTLTGANSYTLNPGGLTGSLIVVSPTSTSIYTITGSNGACSSTATNTVMVDPAFTVSAQSSSNNICAGVACNLSVSGANTYSWSFGSTSSNPTVTPIITSTYSVIGFINTCTNLAQITITVIPTPPFTILSLPSNTVCAGDTVTLYANGPYTTYSWSTPSPGSSFTLAPLNTTTVMVTASGNPGGCSTSSIVNVNVSLPLSQLFYSSSLSCFGVCNGSLNAQSSGGTPPYTYTLFPLGCSSLPCTNLCAGNYSLEVKDLFGCSSTQSFVIGSPSVLVISTIQSSPSSCASCNDGTLQSTVAGGTTPYTYTWIPSGGNNAIASNLLPGCYTLVVQDGNLCQTQSSACVDFNTGLESLQNIFAQLHIYPNPAIDEITIQFTGNTFNCSLYNNLGQLILDQKNKKDQTQLRWVDLSKGAYYLEIELRGERIRKKLMIE